MSWRLQVSLTTLLVWSAVGAIILWLNLQPRLTEVSGNEYGFPFGCINHWVDVGNDSFRIIRYDHFVAICSDDGATFRINLPWAVLNLGLIGSAFFFINWTIGRYFKLGRSTKIDNAPNCPAPANLPPKNPSSGDETKEK